MVEEIYGLYTIFWTKRKRSFEYKHDWVWCTWNSPQPWGSSKCKPGDLRIALRKIFGSDAVGSMSFPDLLNKVHYLIGLSVLVDDEVWTDESVFWQNKLQDRARYEVVYRTCPSSSLQATEVV